MLQGIIGGTLLVTCNTVMFDPSVSDPLVLEHGADDYHVAAPLDSIMQITIYEDIATKCFSWSVGSCLQFLCTACVAVRVADTVSSSFIIVFSSMSIIPDNK